MDSPRVLLIAVANPTHRVLLNRFFSGTPHHVVFSTNGEDAYDRFPEVKPDLIMAHLKIDRLDGAELCERIRQRVGGKNVPFVILGDEASAVEGPRTVEKVGADLFITMPVPEARLLSQLEPLLVHGRALSEAATNEDTEALTHSGFDTSLAAPAAPLTDEASTDAEPFDPPEVAFSAVHSLPTESNDVDTVVSYQNPFYEGPADPLIEPASNESVTHVAIEPPMLSEARPAVSTPDPLEEPPIPHNARASGGRSSKATASENRLIAEVPRERTPTGDSGDRVAPVAGARRGLDESQLGKRLAKRVRAMYRQLEEADFYALLNVETGADYERIRASYYELSLEFHPDRFFLLRSGDLKEKIYAIYRKVAKAFEVLGDEKARRAYDASVVKDRAPTPAIASDLTATATTDEGQRYLELAKVAYERGDFNHARLMLSLASAVEQDNLSMKSALQHVVRSSAP